MKNHLKLVKPQKIILTNIEPSFTSDSEYLQVMDEEIDSLLKKFPKASVVANEHDEHLNRLLKKDVRVKKFGNAAHIILPKKYAGKKATVMIRK